jgi:hypothetical protein
MKGARLPSIGWEKGISVVSCFRYYVGMGQKS